MNQKIHKFLLELPGFQRGESSSNANIKKMVDKFYNMEEKKTVLKQYGGRDVTVYKNYKLLKNFQV